MDTKRASTEKKSGAVLEFYPTDKKKKFHDTRLCYDHGIADIGDASTGKPEIKVRGAIPLVGKALTFRWTYYRENQSGVKTLVPYELPIINKRSIKLTAPMLVNCMALGVNIGSSQLLSASRPLCINLMSLIYQDEAIAAVRAYDARYKTHFIHQLLFFYGCVQHIENDDKESLNLLKMAKSLVVAQMWSFMQSLFAIDFCSLALIDFTELLTLFDKLQTLSPIAAMRDERAFSFNKNGFALGKDRKYKTTKKSGAKAATNDNNNNNNNNNNDQVPQEQNEELEEDDMLTSENRRVVLKVTYRRALALYKKQAAAGFDLDDEDDDDGEGLETGASIDDNRDIFAAQRLMASVLSNTPQPARSSSSGAVSIPVTVNVTNNTTGKATFVAMSTDYRQTKILPLDMRTLTDDDWLNLFLTEEVFTKNYTQNRHFCLPGLMIIDAVLAESQGDADFPVKEVSVELLQAVIIKMMIMNKVLVYNTKTNRPVGHRQLQNDVIFKDKFFIAEFPELMFALRSIIDQEINTVSDLHRFVDMRLYAHKQKTEAEKVHIEFSSFGINLCEEQRKAVALAAAMPLLLVNGAGGTGKSTVMRVIYKVMREMYPEAHFLFTAFKNDTVNQMREAITQKGKNEDYRCHFRTTDSVIVCSGVYDKFAPEELEDGCSPNLPITVCFVEEASMLSTYHINRLLDVLVNGNSPHDIDNGHVRRKDSTLKDMSTRSCLQKLLFFGDGDQLEPINPGSPFSDMIDKLSAPRIRLVTNYRTRVQKLNAFLEALRKRDVECCSNSFFDNERVDIKTGSNFLISDLPTGGNRTDPEMMQGYAERFLVLLSRIDPERTKHDDIIAVSPYNDMADLISCCFTFYYFEDWQVQQPAYKRELMKSLGKRGLNSFLEGAGDSSSEEEEEEEGEDDEDSDGEPSVFRRRAAQPPAPVPAPAPRIKKKWTMEDAIRYANVKNDAKKLMFGNTVVAPPTLYVGMDVACLKTDKDNKEIAAGRVAKITDMIDHPAGTKIDKKWVANGMDSSSVLPPGYLPRESTEVELPRADSRPVRTLILDYTTQISFPYGRGIHALLRPSKCRTVHKTQGSQARICIGIYPPGKLATAKILYTGASRAEYQCFTMSTYDNLREMITNEPDTSHSLFASLLVADKDMDAQLSFLREEAETYFKGLEETQGLDFDDEGDDDDDDAGDDDDANSDDLVDITEKEDDMLLDIREEDSDDD